MAYHILKHIAGMSRMASAYFTERMARFDLGAGQQFFMHRIAKYPGVSMAELARMGFYDNCTVTINGGSAHVEYREVIRDYPALMPAADSGSLHFNLWLETDFDLAR